MVAMERGCAEEQGKQGLPGETGLLGEAWAIFSEAGEGPGVLFKLTSELSKLS